MLGRAKLLIRQWYDLKTVCDTEFEMSVWTALDRYIRSGCFERTELARFLCFHYDLSYTELVRLWRSKHGEDKSSATLKSKIFFISKSLEDVFDTEDMTVITAFTTHNEEALIKLKKKITVLFDYFNYGDDRFAKDLVISDCLLDNSMISDLEEDCDIQRYAISDCETELQVLRSLSRSSILDYIDVCDKKKLNYLISVMNKPVYGKHINNSNGNQTTRKAVNQDKIDLLIALNKVDVTDLNELYDRSDSKLGEVDVDRTAIKHEDIETIEHKVENKMVTEFGLADYDTLYEIVKKRQNDTSNILLDKDKREKQRKRILQARKLFTKEGMQALMNSVDPSEVIYFMNGNLDSSE